MVEQRIEQDTEKVTITVDDVQRVLELGRILLSVLTPDELERLSILLSGDNHEGEKVTLVSLDVEAGNS